jgi:hypothetical protein
MKTCLHWNAPGSWLLVRSVGGGGFAFAPRRSRISSISRFNPPSFPLPCSAIPENCAFLAKFSEPSFERRFGPVEFLLIYFASIIGGNLLSLLVHRYHDYRAYGASGGVSGIIYAFILLCPGWDLVLLFNLRVPSWLYAIGYLALSFYGMKTQKDKIGHDAHLGGALVGLFTAALLHPQMVRYSPKLFAAISLGTVLLFIYLARNPLFLPLKALEFGQRTRPARASAPRQVEKEMDAILQKISEKGMDSLTPAEKALLQEVSDKYRRRSTSRNPESGFDL